MTRNKSAVRIPVWRRDASGAPRSEGSPAAAPVAEMPSGDHSGAPDTSTMSREATRSEGPGSASDSADWKTTAMRLQADMQTYRHRQQRWAGDQVARERAALLLGFLDVGDDLEQSLSHLDPRDPVHQGVQLAYDGLLAMLSREGVERIFARGRVFDPALHEAVATVPVAPDSAQDMRVVEVISTGYRLGDQLLRPARVVVAKA